MSKPELDESEYSTWDGRQSHSRTCCHVKRGMIIATANKITLLTFVTDTFGFGS